MALNILLVDDSDVIRAMVARTIHLADIEVDSIVQASNGREALDAMETNWIDLVLADLNMPVMDGATMIKRMRSNPTTADIPVVVVSTEGAEERVRELSAFGVSDWIRKPFTPEEIRDVIGQATERRRCDRRAELAIDRVFCHVIETFAFSFPDECKSVPEEVEGDIVRADISFDGAVVGTLSIAAPAQLCSEMAANILGVDADHPDAELRGPDTLAELANITAGHLCVELDPMRTSSLEPPTAARLEPGTWNAFANHENTRLFSVEDHVLGLHLVVHGLDAASA